MPLESIGAKEGNKKKRLINISRHAPQNVENIGFERRNFSAKQKVENIGFDRRKIFFGEAGIPLKIKYHFIPATVP